jgi:tetratricopeptide (TPR) repeat protein
MQVDDAARPSMYTNLYHWVQILRDLGDLDSAQSAAEALCREATSHLERSQACQSLADIATARGDVGSARRVLEQLVALGRAAVTADPTTSRKLELIATLDQLGDLSRKQGDSWGVLECYGDHGRMAVLRELTSIHGDRASLLTEQCFSLRRAGNAALQLGLIDEARRLLEERLTVARLVSASDPSDRRLIGLVAAALRDLGSLLASFGDPRAGALLSEDLQIRQWLQAGQPHDIAARQELARSHLAMTSVGPDTAGHRQIATTLLTQIEAEGSLDVSGRMMLSGLRSR